MTLIAGHINWTDTDQDLVTTGSGTFASLTVDSLEGIVRADSGLLSANTYIDLPEISEPAAPAADKLRLYVEDIHGFSFFKYLDAGGMKREIVRDSMIIVYNATGSTILANRAVYATGNVGSVPSVALAQSNSAATMPAIGVTIEDIADTTYGRVMQVGLLEDLDTSALTVGDILYVHDTVPGLVRATPPVTPALTQEIGTVLVDDASAGAIQVIARGLTGDEYGTAQNTFLIGDGTAGSKTLTFNAATDASIIWDETKFDLTAAPLTTTGLGTFGSLAVDSISLNGSTITTTANPLLINSAAGEDIEITGNDDLLLAANDEVQIQAANELTLSTIGPGSAHVYIDPLGSIFLRPTADTDDYIKIHTPSNVPHIEAAGANLHIHADGGTIDFGDENLTTTGTVTWSGGGSAAANTAVAHKTTEDAINGLVFCNGAGAYSAKTIGTDVQAFGAVLDDLNTLGASTADGEFLVATGAGTLAWESGSTARDSIGLGTSDAPQFGALGVGAAASAVASIYSLKEYTDQSLVYGVYGGVVNSRDLPVGGVMGMEFEGKRELDGSTAGRSCGFLVGLSAKATFRSETGDANNHTATTIQGVRSQITLDRDGTGTLAGTSGFLFYAFNPNLGGDGGAPTLGTAYAYYDAGITAATTNWGYYGKTRCYIENAAATGTANLELEQLDTDEPFLKYDGTSAADQTKSISTVNGDGSVEGPKNFSSSAGWAFEGMIRIDVNGTDYWMPYYSADTA